MLEVWQFILHIPQELVLFGSWLFQPLPYINMPPVAVISVTGIGAFLGYRLFRLIIGG